MQPVYIVGAGQTAVAEHWERTAGSLAAEALGRALGPIAKDRIEALYVANALGSALHVQGQFGAAITTACGLSGVEAFTIDAAGASGGVALRQACLAVQEEINANRHGGHQKEAKNQKLDDTSTIHESLNQLLTIRSLVDWIIGFPEPPDLP